MSCGGPLTLASDPDIAGLGVLIAFCAACALTMVLTWPFFAKLPWSEYFTTYFDHLVWRAAKRRGFFQETEWTAKSERDENRHRALVLALSDTQLIASIAMMIAVALKNDVSLYHFSVVYSLVWMAAAAHFTALSYAAPRLAGFPALRAARFASLLLMVALLLFFAVVKGTDSFYERHPGTPVRCLLPVEPADVGGENFSSLATDLIFITINLTTTTARLFPALAQVPPSLARFGQSLARLVTNLISKPFRSLPQSRSRCPVRVVLDTVMCIVLWFPLSVLLMLLKLLYLVILEVFQGMVVSIFVDFIWFALGILEILGSKSWASEYMSEEDYQAELSWGFGQVVAVLLVMAPLWSFWLTRKEIAYEEAAKARQHLLPFVRPAAEEAQASPTPNMPPFRLFHAGAPRTLTV